MARMVKPAANFDQPHPLTHEIVQAYQDGIPLKTMYKQFNTGCERVRRVLRAAGFDLNAKRVYKGIEYKIRDSILPIPDGLLQIIPDTRYLPRFKQEKMIELFAINQDPVFLKQAFTECLKYLPEQTDETNGMA